MRTHNLHKWDVEPTRAVEIQKALRDRVSLKNSPSLKRVRWVGGADFSYDQGDETTYGAVVVLSFPDLQIVEEKWFRGRVSFPYVPGLLSFREAPILLQAFSLLHRRPDVVIFDGQGIAHPRGFGLASHAGLFLDLPSIGCAKTRLVGEHSGVAEERGSYARLTYQRKRVGSVLRTRTSVKPLFVSPGHRISFQTANKLVLESCRGFRLPEPIRLAHQLVIRVRKQRR